MKLNLLPPNHSSLPFSILFLRTIQRRWICSDQDLDREEKRRERERACYWMASPLPISSIRLPALIILIPINIILNSNHTNNRVVYQYLPLLLHQILHLQITLPQVAANQPEEVTAVLPLPPRILSPLPLIKRWISMLMLPLQNYPILLRSLLFLNWDPFLPFKEANQVKSKVKVNYRMAFIHPIIPIRTVQPISTLLLQIIFQCLQLLRISWEKVRGISQW